MIGVGMAWASILSMPYVILSSSIPAGKMGIYMGIFNFFITLPQIVNGRSAAGSSNTFTAISRSIPSSSPDFA